MNLLYINSQEYKDRIEELYLESFPEDERFPFWMLEECSKENNSDLLAIVDNGVFVGMSYIVNCHDAYYLMYLAVEPNLRNKNYGSHILMNERMPDILSGAMGNYTYTARFETMDEVNSFINAVLQEVNYES